MNNQQTEKIKKPILIPLAIAFCAFIAITFLLINWMHQVHINTTNNTNLESVKSLFTAELDEETFFIASQLDNLENNLDLQTAFITGNREQLQKIAAPIFEQIRSKYQLSHFYFINPDKTCFLRAHKPDFHGDTISRLTLDQASRQQSTASGLELGPLGTLTLRVVRPWLINGHLAGYLEIGRDIRQILPELRSILGVHLIASINRSRLPIATPIATTSNESHDHLVIDRTMTNLSRTEEEHLLSQGDREPTFQTNLQGREYRCSSVPINDLNNMRIGDIFILADVTIQNSAFKRVSLIIIACASALGLIIFFLFSLHIGRLEKRLLNTTNSLRLKTEEHKLAREAEQQGGARYKSLLDTIPHGVQESDNHGIITLSNPAHHKILGYGPGELIGKTIWALHADKHEQQNLQEHLAYLVAEQPPPTPYISLNRTKDGRDINVEVVWDYKRDPAGKLIGFIAIITDVSERLQAERNLKESEERYRDLIESASDLIQMVQPDGKILYANRAWRDTLGYTEEEVVNLTLEDIIDPHCQDRCHATFTQVLSVGKADQIEATFIAKDGHKITVEGTANCKYVDNKPSLTRCIFRDVTDKKAAEERLLRAQKLDSLGVLAGGIAHDFNNLLTVIVGNISLAMLHAHNDSKLLKILTTTEKASTRAGELTKQLLTFSKGGAPVKKVTAIGNLLRDAAKFVLTGANVSCRYDIAADLHLLEVDEGQLSQVINNLVINGRQAMKNGGIIDISAQNIQITTDNSLDLPSGQYAEIIITDQGKGIDADQLDKIFDPYFTTKANGSGLGLAVAYSIIKNHDGQISVTSQPGAGSTFHIYLPASNKQLAEEAITDNTTHQGSGRILVMDDEEIIRDVATGLLTHLNYEATTARDGEEAIALYRQAMEENQPFAAVLMDLTIPGGMGGREAITKLLALDPNTKAIVSSGYANDPIMADYQKYGFAGMVSKPYKIHDLSQALYKILQER